MQLYGDSISTEYRTFTFQSQALFQSFFAGQADPAASADHAMPRQIMTAAYRPHDLARCSGLSCGARDVAIGSDLTARYIADERPQFFQHHHGLLPNSEYAQQYVTFTF